MNYSIISSKIRKTLVCSYCGNDLSMTTVGCECSACHSKYSYTSSGSLDLRLKRRKTYSLEFELGVPLLPESSFAFEPLEMNAEPEVDFSDVTVPFHLSREILSYFPKAQSADSLALDLGSGDGVHKGVCEHAGFEWVGIDYSSENAPILADGHSLPFRDNTFDFLLSITVLEHIQFPFVMMHEAYRVLKPHGKFIGVVAFLEPFHGNSFYHHTHLGVYNSLHNGGFNIDKIAPNERWPVLIAQANMALFPKMPKPLPDAIVFPIQLLHKLWWKSAAFLIKNRYDVSESKRIRNTAGSFTFIVNK